MIVKFSLLIVPNKNGGFGIEFHLVDCSFYMDFKKLTTKYNPELMKNVSLKLIKFNKHNAINGSFTFAENIRDFQFINQVDSRKRNGKRWLVYNVTINGCQILENTLGKSNPIFDVLMNEVRKSIKNLPRRCPLKKDTEISLLNLYYNEEMFPPYLPSGTFDTFLMLTSKKKMMLQIETITYVEARNSESHRRRKLE
ncbi:uncharacterized protein LOC101897829 [Musca domestica]|uniref:Uncharacterized protein LOC101897829 n=1 Tax=Musca domestica TaxID=7370 RepID=A0A1I8N3W9_MUSDO|nr:uncharacterized protein LOC101897829 [Musca domestica]